VITGYLDGCKRRFCKFRGRERSDLRGGKDSLSSISMISDPADRKATSSDSSVDSDSDELLPEFGSELMVLKEAGLESEEDGPDKWGEEAKGDRCGRLTGPRYKCSLACRHSS
jgi:hypothetical protein